MSTQTEQSPSIAPTGKDVNSSKHDFAVQMIISLFSSSTQARDWFIIFIIGGILEHLQRFFVSVWKNLVSQFWITVTLDHYDDSYYWVMLWVSKKPEWTRARELSIDTNPLGVRAITGFTEGEGDDDLQHRIRFLPSYTRSASLWHRGNYIRLSRSQVLDGMYTKDVLTMKILARNHKIVNQLLLDAKRVWKLAKAESIFIYASDTRNEWRFVASRPKRPLCSIVLDGGIKENILDDAKDFLNSRKWYAERGIPFRRGYLLHGAPGTGKTSIIHSLAGELGLDVFIISLSRSTLDDNALHQLIADLPEKCIALMEDIDAAFHHSVGRRTEKEGEDFIIGGKGEGNPTDRTPKISLSGLLNALDGVGAQEGRLLFATTNRYEVLDPALRRPGRMDVHVEFKLTSQHQASELFRRFYKPENSTSRTIEGPLGDGGSDKVSGYFTPPTNKELRDLESPGCLPPRQKEVSLAELVVLSEKFKERIPDREISMAALQGYLMMYKDRPHDAVERVGVWVQERTRAKEVEVTVEEGTHGCVTQRSRGMIEKIDKPADGGDQRA